MPRKKKETSVDILTAPKRKYVRKSNIKPKKTLNIVLEKEKPPVKEELLSDEEIEEISSEEEVLPPSPVVSVESFIKEPEEDLDDDSVEEENVKVVEKIVEKIVKVEVPVEKIVEVEKIVKVEVPVEKIVEVIKEVPVEKEVIKEVPGKTSSMKLSQFYTCMSVTNGELTLHYVGPKSKCEKYQSKSQKPNSFIMQCKESIKLV